MDQANTQKPSAQNTSNVANLIFAVVIIVLAIIGGKLFIDNVNNESSDVAGAETEQTSTGNEVVGQTIGEQVSKLILVNDEVPTVATIVNIEDLLEDNPDFYGDAQNGDKLVIYSDKAIIFREEDNLIINVLPVERVTSESETKTE